MTAKPATAERSRRRKFDIDEVANTFAAHQAPEKDNLDERLKRAARAEEAAAHAEAQRLTLIPDTGVKTYKPGMKVQVGERLMVPLRLITDGPNNSRAVYTEAAVADLALSIAQHGQLQAALAYAPTQNKTSFALKEGHTRARALGRLNHDAILVEVAPPVADALDDYAQSRELNLKRKQLSVFDDAMRFRDLLDALRAASATARSE